MASSKRLGPLLCWAVVFADIGTSQYYVPGILYGEVGRPAAAFVLLTGLCFILLARKYVEITSRYKDGGGVVSAATEVWGPIVGLVGGLLITVDYFLTGAISAVSGFDYIASIVPLGSFRLFFPCVALLFLGWLNLVGIKESAFVSAVMAICAFAVSLLVIFLTLLKIAPFHWQAMSDNVLAVRQMDPLSFLKGFAGAWLAFSGLESMSQLSPALQEPKHEVARTAMWGVAVSVLLTSPVLTALCIATLDPATVNPDSFISELGGYAGGPGIKALVVVSASSLLLFAANTAIIGCYHVFVAVAREGYLPQTLARLNYRYGTPHQAIAIAVVVPILVILFSNGSMTLLGELYAFGLLGAFTLSSLAMDVVAWREGRVGANWVLGILTTLLVGAAWVCNLYFKIQSTIFGGALLSVGLALAISVKRGWLRGDMNVVPFMTAEAAESAAEQVPSMRKILSLPEAVDLLPVYPAGVLVPTRGFRAPLLDAALALAKERNLTAVHVLFVDEIPGLFYPPKVGPSPDAVKTLDQSSTYLENKGIAAVPVWRMAHDTPASIAGAASRLGSRVVMLGTSERNPLWTVLRGSVLRGLTDKLDDNIQLMVADTSGKNPGPERTSGPQPVIRG